jgi:predicted aspartyl protease
VIRDTYTTYSGVPAPFVHVTLRCRQNEQEASEIPAQIDTAADRTVIPAKFVDELGLIQMGQMSVLGFAGKVSVVPTFIAEVTIRSLRPLEVKVVADDSEPFVLLRRDILNQLGVTGCPLFKWP